MTRYALPPSVASLLKGGELFEEKYRLLRFLGEGAFACVIHARHEAMDRDVALKFLRPDVIKAHPEASERFLTEVRLSSRLTSPHTVTIFDFGSTDEEIPFMVMEYIKGKPLDEAMAKHGALGFKRSIKLTLQILDSLEEAHSQGIIHRDLKPANIMVGKGTGKGLQVKVLDFGVAKLLEEPGQALNTQAGRRSTQFIGTPRYMSPEQILGRQVSPASDLYSLGLIFYEMATGEASIPVDNVAQVAQAHLAEEPLKLEALDELPEVLAKIVQRATTRHARDRFVDAHGFREALNDALEQGKRRHRQATTAAHTPASAKVGEPEVHHSDVFSGEGYIEPPDDEELEKSSRLSSGAGVGTGPGVRPPSPGSAPGRRSSPAPGGAPSSPGAVSGELDGKRPSTGSGLELDMDSVRQQKMEAARKRRADHRREVREVSERHRLSQIMWVTSTAGVVVAGFITFVVVGGALGNLAVPMRAALAMTPTLLALVWAIFSENTFPDRLRRTMIPWAKRSMGMIPLVVVVLFLIMPAGAHHSLQEDALWYMAEWPEALQMPWLASMTETVCEVTAGLMRMGARVIPWSS